MVQHLATEQKCSANSGFPALNGKKTVIMIGLFERGGAERQAYLLARESRRAGLDVEVWALTRNGAYQQEFEAAGIPTRALEFPPPPLLGETRLERGIQLVQRVRPVVSQIRKARVDVLLPFTTWPNVVAGLGYRFAGVKLCIWGERHCGDERAHMERFALAQYRRFVANSTAGVEFLANEKRVPRENISFVPNGVEECGANGANWRVRLNISPSQPLVVKIANINHRKDHLTLLRAWKIVQDSWRGNERPVLALAGHYGDTYDACAAFCAEAGLQSTVRFIGSIPDVPSLIAASDLAAFSSLAEGMPNGVLECMAAGKAVIASDLPGVRDALGPEAGDVVVPLRDSERFAQLLLQLIGNEQKRRELGDRNLRRVRTEFSVRRMASRYLGVVEGELRRPRIGFAQLTARRQWNTR